MALPIKRLVGAAALAASLGLGGAWQLIGKFEGPPATKTYRDPLGIPTICRGATGALAARGYATLAECDEQAVKDIQIAAATVKSCVKVDLTQGEYNAWTSFAYNVGPGRKGVKDGMCVLKSGAVPSHVRLLAAGRHLDACKMLLQWTQPGTVVHNGLKARRTDELAMCLKDLP